MKDARELARNGRWAEAIALLERLLAEAPDDVDALHDLGILRVMSGQLDAGAELVGRAAALRPDSAACLNSLGQVELARGRPDAALIALSRAVALDPAVATIHLNHGVAQERLGQAEAALVSYERALALAPRLAGAHANRANLLLTLRRHDAALAAYDAALALAPSDPALWAGHGQALRRLGQPDLALESYGRAIGLKPDRPETWADRGAALLELARLSEALESFERAVALRPDFVTARFNIGFTRLLDGDLAGGWPLFELRWRFGRGLVEDRRFPQPRWTGAEPLEGRTILVHHEQGLGDTLQFLRYVPMLARRGARVLLEAPRTLHPLAERLEGVAELLAPGGPYPAFDYYCPIMSLALAFDTRLDTIPAEIPYLTPDPAAVERWRARLGPATGPRIGLAWSGNPDFEANARRSVPLAKLVAALPDWAELVSLQTVVLPGDAAALAGSRVRDFGGELHDFGDSAALTSLMDVVVSTDTAPPHLAGALGKPGWVLLSFSPDWRWLLDRPDSPWYPSLSLLRQPRLGDWDAVLGQLGEALEPLRS